MRACTGKSRLSSAAWRLAAGAAAIAAAGVISLPSMPAQAAEASPGVLRELENAFTSLAEKAEPSVVSITAEKKVTEDAGDAQDFFFGFPFGNTRPRTRQTPQRVGGSGFIVRSDGYILTNDHVVGGADNVTVKLKDGTEYKGTVLRDQKTDLALVKVNAKDLPAVKLGDSSKLKPGAWAVAIGSPFGLDNTLTVGVISALEREAAIPDGAGSARYYASLIQTDASINPGNSGGPLLDVDGEVIGVNVAIESPTGANAGIGYAIPVNTAKFVMEQLIAKGKVVRGFLGLVPQNVTPYQAKQYGVAKGAFVQAVSDGTPAAKAGIQVEDVIVEIDGKPIASALDLRDTMARLAPGTKASIVVVRAKQRKTIAVTVGEDTTQTAQADGNAPQTDIGVTVQNLTPQMRSQLKMDQAVKGVAVTGVEAGGPASQAGVREGDVIQKVNGTPTPDTATFKKATASLKSGDVATVVIRRSDASSVLDIRIP